MIQNQEYFYKKINTTNSTPKSININQYNKTINYKITNTNINNNITNFIYPFTSLNKFGKKLSGDSEGTSQNSSDIKFEYSPNLLKQQILSPEDDDLCLSYKKDNKSKNNNNKYDDNYFLNYAMNNRILNESKNNSSKKTLILDLDETLVHSSFYPFNCDDETKNIKPDIFFTILFNNNYYDVYVLLRPYFHEFINKMSKIFNIYIFTASIKEYAEPLLIKLDKNNLIKKKLFRDNCTLSDDNKYIKDLNTLNENLKNVILIDNNPNSYRYNKCNGIPITTWHHDKNDKELIKIIPFLAFLSTVEDVREYIPKIVIDDEINYKKIYNILDEFNSKKDCNKTTEIKKYEKKLINIIRKNPNNIKNKNKKCSNNKIKINYPQFFTNNLSIENNIDNEVNEDNKIFASSINFNKFEERKNDNRTLNDNNNKCFHSPATINFREPSNICDFQKNNNIRNNNTNLYKSNYNINRIRKIEQNKYIRSKSSYNLDDQSENRNSKNSVINFNMVNNQMMNKNKSNSKINNNQKIKNYKSYNNNNMNMNNYINKINEEKPSVFLENNDYYLFTLNQNENFRNYNINNIINNKIAKNHINNKSLEHKMSLSNRLIKIKNNNQMQKNNQNKNANNIKQQKENLFRYKNYLNKNIIKENNKNQENEYNIKYNLINAKNMNNKIQNYKSKNPKAKRNVTGRNNDNILKRNQNIDKFVSTSETGEMDKNINNNMNYINNINNENTNEIYKNNINDNNNKFDTNEIDKTKIKRCSTLNSYHMNNHYKKLKDKVEENKNNTMEITKNIKSRFFNNDNYAINLKGIARKNKSLNNKKLNKNFNIDRRKNNKINRENNLLDKFIKELNNSTKKKNSKILNEPKEKIESRTQRYSRYIPTKKFVNYNCDSIYNENQKNKNEKLFKNSKFDDGNLFSNYRKNINYKSNKGNSNYLRKKTKNINYEGNYMNFNEGEKNDEINTFNNIKNIKYSSIEKDSVKNTTKKYSEMDNKRGTLINNKSNYLIKLYYSYANSNM